MRWPRRTLLAALVSVGLGACLSPTLPLPPPGEPTVEQVGHQQYRLSGRVSGPGWVVALNVRTGVLAGDTTEADGRYAFVVTALREDVITLWYSTGGELSDPTEFRLRQLLPSASDDAGVPGAGDAGP
jgi:hypothetical protein